MRRGRRYRLAQWLVWNGLGWCGCVRFTRFPWRHFV